MPRVRLIHWNQAEAKQRAEDLAAAGYEPDFRALHPPGLIPELRTDPPAAVVIDLDRLPIQGRDVAVIIRKSKATRQIPIVFAGGEPEKVSRIQKVLPDVICTDWRRIGGALKKAIAHPPGNPVVPESALAGYSGTPLPKKLGIKENSVVALAGAPADFRKTLGALPDGASLQDGVRGKADLILWFTRSLKELQGQMDRMATRTGSGKLWIAWPKKASGVATDVTEREVRETGLAAGLVDFKICAIDATWSGLLFTRRKTGKG